MLLTLYSALVLRSYVFCVGSAGLQLMALAYYLASYLPGGTTGVKVFFRMVFKTVRHIVAPCMGYILKGCTMCIRSLSSS